MSAIDTEPFPKSMLLAAAVLVCVAIAAAGWGRLTHTPEIAAAERIQAMGPPSAVVELNFFDEPDGSVVVRNAATQAVVEVIAPGSDGFIRGVMRGLAHNRRARNIDSAPPFRLSQWPTGDVVLEDPSTGRTIDLRAFGTTNKDAFARLIAATEDVT